MSTQHIQAISVTIHQTTLAEINLRKEGGMNVSWIVDRDLVRLYSLYEQYRPAVLALFDEQELKVISDVLKPNRVQLRLGRAMVVRAMVVDGMGAHPEIAKKIQQLGMIELMTLVDTVALAEAQEVDAEAS